jgi:hypothetical protein
MGTPKVSFAEGIRLASPGEVVGVGKVRFNRSGAAGVSFAKPATGAYAVLVTGDGSNGGALGKSSAVFTVRDPKPEGFIVISSDNNCVQEVSWLAVAI